MVELFFRGGAQPPLPVGELGRDAPGFVPAERASRGLGVPRALHLRWAGLLGAAMPGAAPAVAQNAAVIPVSVVVVDVPGNPSVLGAAPAGWMAEVGIGVQGGAPGRRYSAASGALMVVPEAIEPDRVRVRLEYVGN